MTSDNPRTKTPTVRNSKREQRIEHKLRAVERWAARRLGELHHERRVRDIALAIFKLTADLHHLPASHRSLLAMAALVHDVGRFHDNEDHELHGYRLLMEDDSLPLGSHERRGLAFLTRYHRGAVPSSAHPEPLSRYDDAAGLRLLLGMLRVADRFDSRSIDPPRLVLSRCGRRLQVTAHLIDPTEKVIRRFSKRKKLELLENELGIEIDVRLEVSQELALIPS